MARGRAVRGRSARRPRRRRRDHRRNLALERQDGRANARLDAEALDRHAPLRGRALALVERAAQARGLSARAVQGLRRVARTLADLAGEARPGEAHLLEALALRAALE
jgi:magnesium chelatase family protein